MRAAAQRSFGKRHGISPPAPNGVEVGGPASRWLDADVIRFKLSPGYWLGISALSVAFLAGGAFLVQSMHSRPFDDIERLVMTGLCFALGVYFLVVIAFRDRIPFSCEIDHSEIRLFEPFAVIWALMMGKMPGRSIPLAVIEKVSRAPAANSTHGAFFTFLFLPALFFANRRKVRFLLKRSGGRRHIDILIVHRGMSRAQFGELLTYRIAKAKGENPPPPEFS